MRFSTLMAIDALNSLEHGDAEYAHSTADNILLDWLKENGERGIAEAFEAASERVGFWYA